MASNYDAIPVGVAVAAPVDENVATGTEAHGACLREGGKEAPAQIPNSR